MKMRHYLRRLRNLGLKPSHSTRAYRESGKPCSCMFCSPYRLSGPKHSVLKRME